MDKMMRLKQDNSSLATFSSAGRIAAALLAIVAWIGLALYLQESHDISGTWVGAIWMNAAYLTDLSNLALAIVLTSVALAQKTGSKPAAVGWAVAGIAAVGVGFQIAGGSLSFAKSATENILLHGVTPIAAIIFWITFVPKGYLQWKNLILWMAWPLGYWTYAVTRGLISGKFPYPFMDLSKHSASSVAIMIGVMVLVYALLALLLKAIDRALRARNFGPVAV